MEIEGNDVPLVSVICNTFNQEAYVADALNGFLMQQIDGRVELLLHDDASTDNTVSIIKSFEGKMPANFEFRPIYQEVNQYSQGIKIGAAYQYPRVRGKYIAICEGDDYWTDPLKLQKQVDFLEHNPGYGLVHGECDFVYANGKVEHKKNSLLNLKLEYNNDSDVLFDALIAGSYIIRTATVLFSKACFDSIQQFDNGEKRRFAMGDTPMWLLMSQKTHFHYINEVFAAYRISPNSASRPKKIDVHLKFRLSMMEMRIWFLQTFKKPIPDKILKQYNERLINYKIFRYDYKEMYPLQQPANAQTILYKYLKYSVVRSCLKVLKIDFLKFYIKNLIQR